MQTANRVLIVEDDFLVGESLRGTLEDEGYTVIGDTASGEEAVELTAELEPDVVMMDIKLLDMNGLEAARRITAQCPTPIVALTAHENPELVTEASESGIGYYLVKPAQRRELTRAIQIATARFDDLVRLRHLNTKLQDALNEAQRRESETRWLLEASQAIVESHTFEDAAQRIFDVAREATGAISGYVALMSEDGEENELLFVESGGLPCEVDPDLPMPIRGLRAEAYAQADVVYDNDFQNSQWMRFIPPKHVEMRNVLFAPLVIKDQAVGVMGLANKPEDFTEDDVKMAAAFGDMAAIALRRTQIEDKLRESEERYRKAEKIAHLGSWEMDIATGECVWSDEFFRICGYEPGSFEPDADAGFEIIHPDDRERAGQHVNKAIVTGEPYDIEKRIVQPDGTVRWVHSIGEVTFDDHGELVKLLGSFLDITERKRAEEKLERYAAELERSNQELEQFASMISHDLREPARMVKSFVTLLDERYQGQLDEKADMLIDYAVDGAERMQAMIEALLDLSRIGTRGKEPAPTNTEEVLKRVLRSLERAIEDANAEVTHDSLPTVMADRAHLAQVFQNLIANAIKFQRDGVPPRIHISAEQAGDEWVFSVTDNGIGIDSEQADRIFHIFQRLHTEDEYAGLGIGLALCKRIVERHGGRIWMESTPGNGTTFLFTLPASKKLRT